MVSERLQFIRLSMNCKKDLWQWGSNEDASDEEVTDSNKCHSVHKLGTNKYITID